MKQKRKIKLTYYYVTALIIIVIAAIILLVSLQTTGNSFSMMQQDIDRYNTDRDAFDNVKAASAYLTDEARYFVSTGKREHLENYLNEARITRRRDNALAAIKEREGESALYNLLEHSTNTSNELMKTEVYAFQLAADAYGVDISDLDLEEYGVSVSEEDRALSDHDKKDKAVSMLFDEEYIRMKSIIEDNVYEGVSSIVNNTRAEKDDRTEETYRLLAREHIMVFVLIALCVLTVVMTFFLLIAPIRKNILCIREDKEMPDSAVLELAYLSDAYNTLHHEKKTNISQLSYEASHDGLTGLYNRKAFEEKTADLSNEDVALMLVDVDYFKTINDTHGHDIGDLVLRKVADTLHHTFRSNDFVFRLGGDEFAVLLINMKYEYKDVLKMKLANIQKVLLKADGLPPITLSIGVAFGKDPGKETLFKKADLALYRSKENGRNQAAFYKA